MRLKRGVPANPVMLTCPTCGEPFGVFRSEAGRRVYCSQDCKAGLLPDGVNKRCSKCAEVKPRSQFFRTTQGRASLMGRCKSCFTEYQRPYEAQRNQSDPARTARRRHGLTKEDYYAQVERQRGLCAICERVPRGHTNLAIDHDHRTGKVRGLVCRPCNTAIGQGRDTPAIFRQAVAYLKCPPLIDLKLRDNWHEPTDPMKRKP